MTKIFWCKNCVAMSTRPRINFDSNGFCNACNWSIEKKKLNWKKRSIILKKLLSKHKKNNGEYNCISTVSGGKDGSYVAYNLKNKLRLNPLTVTVRPPLETDLGKKKFIKFYTV